MICVNDICGKAPHVRASDVAKAMTLQQPVSYEEKLSLVPIALEIAKSVESRPQQIKAWCDKTGRTMGLYYECLKMINNAPAPAEIAETVV